MDDDLHLKAFLCTLNHFALIHNKPTCELFELNGVFGIGAPGHPGLLILDPDPVDPNVTLHMLTEDGFEELEQFPLWAIGVALVTFVEDVL